MMSLDPVLLNIFCFASSNIAGLSTILPCPYKGLSPLFSSEYGMTASSTISLTLLLLEPCDITVGLRVFTLSRECFRSLRLLMRLELKKTSELIRHLFECWGLGTCVPPCSLNTVFSYVTIKSGLPYLAPTRIYTRFSTGILIVFCIKSGGLSDLIAAPLLLPLALGTLPIPIFDLGERIRRGRPSSPLILF